MSTNNLGKYEFDVYKSLYRLTDKINLPEFLLREKIESDKTNIIGRNIKLGLEYKITNKFKLMAGAYGMYDKKANGFDIKAQYGDKSKFYTDLTLKYGYSNILRDVNIYEVDTNLIYTFNLSNKFSLTPAMNLNYKYNINSYDVIGLDNKGAKSKI